VFLIRRREKHAFAGAGKADEYGEHLRHEIGMLWKLLGDRKIFVPNVHNVANVVNVPHIGDSICVRSEGRLPPLLLIQIRNQSIPVSDFP
jgi:hypothetical protein